MLENSKLTVWRLNLCRNALLDTKDGIISDMMGWREGIEQMEGKE